MFEILKELNFPQGDYVVVGGGVLEAHGIRKTDDLDILVTPQLFQKLRLEGWLELSMPKLKLKRYLDGPIRKIELYLDVNAGHFHPTTEELISRSSNIQGFSFLRLEDLLQFKLAYNRPKDLKDVELILNYAHSNNE